MKFQELKPKDQQKFLAASMRDPSVRKMHRAAEQYEQRGQYAQAMQMHQQIEAMKAR